MRLVLDRADADLETSLIAGNSFDYPALHGKSLMAAGFAFVSTSDEVIEENILDINRYRYIDLIVGEEKTTRTTKYHEKSMFRAFPEGLKDQIEIFLKSGGRGFITGAYIGTELFSSGSKDSSDIIFAQNTLKVFHRTGHAVKTGGVFSVDPLIASHIGEFSFNTDYNANIYRVEAPDALEPFDTTAQTLFRYTENNMSAGIGFKGPYHLVVLGFPFETVLGDEDRDALIKGIFEYLER